MGCRHQDSCCTVLRRQVRTPCVLKCLPHLEVHAQHAQVDDQQGQGGQCQASEGQRHNRRTTLGRGTLWGTHNTRHTAGNMALTSCAHEQVSQQLSTARKPAAAPLPHTVLLPLSRRTHEGVCNVWLHAADRLVPCRQQLGLGCCP